MFTCRLKEEPKEMPEKLVLAWWLRQQMTVGPRWLSERLWGDESGVSKAIRSVKESRDAALERARKKLLKSAGHDGQSKIRFTS